MKCLLVSIIPFIIICDPIKDKSSKTQNKQPSLLRYSALLCFFPPPSKTVVFLDCGRIQSRAICCVLCFVLSLGWSNSTNNESFRIDHLLLVLVPGYCRIRPPRFNVWAIPPSKEHRAKLNKSLKALRIAMICESLFLLCSQSVWCHNRSIWH